VSLVETCKYLQVDVLARSSKMNLQFFARSSVVVNKQDGFEVNLVLT
jgi:hypothetical protein